MAASNKVVEVLCPTGHRQKVKTEPSMTVLQILQQVCQKQGYSDAEYDLKYVFFYAQFPVISRYIYYVILRFPVISVNSRFLIISCSWIDFPSLFVILSHSCQFAFPSIWDFP